MRRTTWIIALPILFVAGWIGLANRATVLFSLDPFSQDDPAVALQLPLYLLIFSSFLAGLLLGWLALGLRQMARRGAQLAQTATGRLTALLPRPGAKTKTPSE